MSAGPCKGWASSGGGPYGPWSGLPAMAPEAGRWINPAETEEIDPRTNPLVTGPDGYYGWDVAEGCWFVTVHAPGYVPLVSPLVGVPPPVTDLDLRLRPASFVYQPVINK